MFEILLVEDNPMDVLLLREALSESKIPCHLRVAPDGEMALQLILECNNTRSWPDLILLDLNLPGIGGHEVLRRLKMDKRTLRIPVIVMSSSDAEQDVSKAYDLHVNAYVKKPTDIDELFRVAAVIESFWMESVELPRRDGTTGADDKPGRDDVL